MRRVHERPALTPAVSSCVSPLASSKALGARRKTTWPERTVPAMWPFRVSVLRNPLKLQLTDRVASFDFAVVDYQLHRGKSCPFAGSLETRRRSRRRAAAATALRIDRRLARRLLFPETVPDAARWPRGPGPRAAGAPAARGGPARGTAADLSASTTKT